MYEVLSHKINIFNTDQQENSEQVVIRICWVKHNFVLKTDTSKPVAAKSLLHAKGSK